MLYYVVDTDSNEVFKTDTDNERLAIRNYISSKLPRLRGFELNERVEDAQHNVFVVAADSVREIF